MTDPFRSTASFGSSAPAGPQDAPPSGQRTYRCPKCGGEMRSYERNRVTIEQCTECRGIFLDRGELESLMAAEAAAYGGSGPAPAPGYPPAYPPQGYPQGGHHGYDGGGHHGRGRRRGFLGELFD